MKRHSIPIALVAILFTVVFPIAGCKKKPPTTTAEARPPVEEPAPPETRVPPPPSTAPREPVETEVLTQEISEMNKKGYLQDAYFDYDASDLRDDARTNLSANAEWLKRYPSIQVLVEGHCDERGTVEYNQALGEKRAQAARDYLTGAGIDASRIQIVSYGKERPFEPGHDEAAWAKNRRAQFVLR